MTPEERRAKLQAILDRHDDVARTFRQRQMNPLATPNDLMRAVDEALDGMLAANRAVRTLFNEPDDQP